jgi:hypothetical protein
MHATLSRTHTQQKERSNTRLYPLCQLPLPAPVLFFFFFSLWYPLCAERVMTKGLSYWGLEYAAQATSFKQAPGIVSFWNSPIRERNSPQLCAGVCGTRWCRQTSKHANECRQIIDQWKKIQCYYSREVIAGRSITGKKVKKVDGGGAGCRFRTCVN